MAIEDLIQDATRRMDKSVEAAQTEFATLRSGRASPTLLDRVQIDYYGQKTPLKQLATIGAPEPRLLTIQPFDPNSLSSIERAIQESDLGLTPSIEPEGLKDPLEGVEVIPVDVNKLLNEQKQWSDRYDALLQKGEQVG